MGIPGAGKSGHASWYVERGYARLNRDERGGSLAALADVLDEKLSYGPRRVVLDNTYLTRASRRGMGRQPAASGSTHRSPRRRRTSSSGASTAWAGCPSRTS
jgi:hypothetical protein